MSAHDVIQTILVVTSLANAMYGIHLARNEEWAKAAFFMALATWILA